MMKPIAVFGLLALSSIALGGDDKNIRLTTTDGVTLRGEFHPGSKKSACVLILHDLGELRRDEEWHKLAETLAKNGFAVLRFHFRGYGRSTEVDRDTFWSPQFAANRKFVKSASKDEIDDADFDANYHPYLINDIATAKAYLDRKNDAGECNSSNVIVIGCGKSVALAAAWINAEMHRYRLMPPPFLGAPAPLANEPEGTDLLGALFVNLSPQIGKRKLSLATALQPARKRFKFPVVFLHGSEDKTGKNLAKETEKAINPGGKNRLTGITELPDATPNEVERRFLNDGDLQKEILRYLDAIQKERGREWEEQGARDAIYCWRNPYAAASLIPFNQTGSVNPSFAGYDWFMPTR